MFTEPASTRAIADELVITQAAVKQHLANLYDKFGVPAGDSHRRARLANEALRRGAVSLTQLRASESEHWLGADGPVVLVGDQRLPLLLRQLPPRDPARVLRPCVRAHLPALRLTVVVQHEEPAAVGGEAGGHRPKRPGRVPIARRDSTSQRITLPSSPLVASIRPSGENSALSTQPS